jgi:hypothetical protein
MTTTRPSVTTVLTPGTQNATADELDRIAAVADGTAQEFADAGHRVRAEDYREFATTLTERATALRADEQADA